MSAPFGDSSAQAIVMTRRDGFFVLLRSARVFFVDLCCAQYRLPRTANGLLENWPEQKSRHVIYLVLLPLSRSFLSYCSEVDLDMHGLRFQKQSHQWP